MGTSKAAAAKADRLKTAHLQHVQQLAEGIADIMEIRGFLPGTATAHQEYVSCLRFNHSEALSRFSIALDLHTPIINELTATKEKLTEAISGHHDLANRIIARDAAIEKWRDAVASRDRQLEADHQRLIERDTKIEKLRNDIALLNTACDVAHHEKAELTGYLSAHKREIETLKAEQHAAEELVAVLRSQNAELHRKLETAAATNLGPFGIADEKPMSYEQHQEATRAKYRPLWNKLCAVYGHRMPSKGELVTIGVPYDLWSEIMVARQATYDIQDPDHGKKIGCIDSNTGKEYPDAVPIDLYYRMGIDECSKVGDSQPKCHLVWFFPVIR